MLLCHQSAAVPDTRAFNKLSRSAYVPGAAAPPGGRIPAPSHRRSTGTACVTGTPFFFSQKNGRAREARGTSRFLATSGGSEGNTTGAGPRRPELIDRIGFERKQRYESTGRVITLLETAAAQYNSWRYYAQPVSSFRGRRDNPTPNRNSETLPAATGLLDRVAVAGPKATLSNTRL